MKIGLYTIWKEEKREDSREYYGEVITVLE